MDAERGAGLAMTATLTAYALTVSRNTSILAEWRAGIDSMRGHPPPDDIRERDWHQFKLDAIALIDRYGPQLAAAGWDTLDLFGFANRCPGARIDASGIARFLHGGTLVAIERTHVRIRRPTGVELTYSRITPPPGTVPAWTLHSKPQPTRRETVPYEETTTLDPSAFAPPSTSTAAWLRWHAEASQSGLAPGTFSLRSGGEIQPLDLSIGACFDWPTSVIGWGFTEGATGVRPQWLWSTTRSKLPPQPEPIDGKTWKHAFCCQLCVFVAGQPIRVIWESNQVSAWLAFRDTHVALAQLGPRELPKLPILTHAGITANKGPLFKISKFAARPACLPQDPDDIGRNNSGNGRMSSARPGPSVWDAPAPGDDEIPF
jgi:hypothetical protein